MKPHHMTPEQAKEALEAKGYEAVISPSHVVWRASPDLPWNEEIIQLPDEGDIHVSRPVIERVPALNRA